MSLAAVVVKILVFFLEAPSPDCVLLKYNPILVPFSSPGELVCKRLKLA